MITRCVVWRILSLAIVAAFLNSAVSVAHSANLSPRDHTRIESQVARLFELLPPTPQPGPRVVPGPPPPMYIGLSLEGELCQVLSSRTALRDFEVVITCGRERVSFRYGPAELDRSFFGISVFGRFTSFEYSPERIGVSTRLPPQKGLWGMREGALEIQSFSDGRVLVTVIQDGKLLSAMLDRLQFCEGDLAWE